MSQRSSAPVKKIHLGLKPSMGTTYEKLLERSRKRLRLLHSGQEKLDYLVKEEYLRSALLTVENDEYVLVAPILAPAQADCLGYPDPSGTLLSAGMPQLKQELTPSATPMNGAPSTGSDGMVCDLDAALDEALEADIGLTASEPSDLGSLFSSQSRLAPAAADRLAVDQVLACVEASSQFLSEVVEVCATSEDPIQDIRRLERKKGMTSGPARQFMAAREPEFAAYVDGYLVPFTAPAIRAEVVGRDVIRIRVQLRQTRAENDIYRTDVLEAVGVGVPKGVTSLGEHELRFVGLADWQRAVLLLLRGAGEPLNLGVVETVSTTQLARRAALVVDAGSWSDLRHAALEVLSALQSPVNAKCVEPPSGGVAAA